MRIQEALSAFLQQLEADGRSPHTLNQYRRHVLLLDTWLRRAGRTTSVADLAPAMLAEFLSSDVVKATVRGAPRRATSANALRTSLRCFCAHLADVGVIASNPARLLRRARCTPPPPKALHPDEQKRLLQVLADAKGVEAVRDRLLLQLLLGTGVRIGSALGLNVEDLDLDHGELVVRAAKNDRPFTAVVPKALVAALRRFIGARTSGPLFLAGDHRISLRHAQRRLAGWFVAAKIAGRSAHSLRHSYATRLLERTGDLRLVQQALNHASIVSTTIYTTANRARLRAAVGA